jgi:hypothetical protein
MVPPSNRTAHIIVSSKETTGVAFTIRLKPLDILAGSRRGVQLEREMRIWSWGAKAHRGFLSWAVFALFNGILICRDRR